MAQAARLAMPDVRVEQAARLAMPASPWSTQSCVPHRQSCRWSAFLSRSATGPCLWGRLFVWGRLSSLRPAFQPAWAPFAHCSLRHPMPRRVVADQRVRPPWGRLLLWGRLSSLRPAFQPALAPLTHRPLLNPMLCLVGADQRVRPFSSDLGALSCSRKGAVPRGASRQACHAGGHAGRATRSAAVGELDTPTAAKTGGVARRTARSTSSRPFSSPLRVLCTTSP